MRKLSRINESAWGEMRHRSSGKVTRKEDDFNNLTIPELENHIKSIYSDVFDKCDFPGFTIEAEEEFPTGENSAEGYPHIHICYWNSKQQKVFSIEYEGKGYLRYTINNSWFYNHPESRTINITMWDAAGKRLSNKLLNIIQQDKSLSIETTNTEFGFRVYKKLSHIADNNTFNKVVAYILDAYKIK